MAYDVTLDGSTFRTMMGIDPERAAEFMQEHGADIVALELRHRHGHGARARGGRAAIEQSTSLPVMVQPNAGQPKLVEHESGLRRDARSRWSTGVVPLLEAGANIIGACCGSTPDHIRAFRQAMRSTDV